MTAAPSVLKNCKLYIGEFDLSGLSNSLRLTDEIEAKEYRVFGNATPCYIPGLATISFEHRGYWAADGTNLNASDEAISSRLAVQSVPMMVCPTTGAIGSPAFFAPQLATKYSTGDAVGELDPFTVTGSGQGYRLVRGQIMATGAKTSTASGAAYQLGAVTAATNHLYAQLHVFAASGTSPTLDVIVESDNAEGFSSGATRITFAQATGPTSEWATPVAGPITDDWWRVSWTIGGTDDPSFTFAVAIGIR